MARGVAGSGPVTYPQIALAVLYHRGNKIIADALAVAFLVPVYGVLVSVVSIQAVSCTKPHETPAVLQDAGDIALRQPRNDPRSLEFQVGGLAQGVEG